MENNINQVVDGFGELLFNRMGKAYARRYMQQIEDNLLGAKAEAAIFSWLYWNSIEVKVNEDLKTGGADFLCRSVSGGEFIVEVTTIQSDRVTADSGYPDWSAVESDGPLPPEQRIITGNFGLITEDLKSVVIERKLQQVDRYKMPRVVVVVSDHMGADVLLGREAARVLLTSGWTWTTTYYSDGTNRTDLTTDLMRSAFLMPDQLNQAEIEPIFRKVSAVLLVALNQHAMSVVCIIHPEAKFPFNINTLPIVPWVYIREWPIVNGQIRHHWTDAAAYSWELKRIKLEDRR
jgi:hypothetical protein